MINMKLPLTLVLISTLLTATLLYGIFAIFREKTVDAKIKEIGTVTYQNSELKAWKAGSCYVFGVHFEGREGVSYFSNCQGK